LAASVTAQATNVVCGQLCYSFMNSTTVYCQPKLHMHVTTSCVKYHKMFQTAWKETPTTRSGLLDRLRKRTLNCIALLYKWYTSQQWF